MTRPSPGAQLRGLMARGFVAAPGASDPFTARLIERAGFGAVYLGGNALGATLAKGQPLVTLSETAEAAARITLSVETPLIVDAGAGFGAPAHVHRTVRELEAAGAAALHIDDQPYPKSPSYHRQKGDLAPIDVVQARLAVARQARRDPDLMVIARTDAFRVTGGLDAAIERGRAYLAAGADALMVLDLGPDGAGEVRTALPGASLVWIGGVPEPAPSTTVLGEAGFALALYPFNTIAAVAEAVSRLWDGAAASGAPDQDGRMLTRWRRELAEIAGMPAYWDIEDRLAAGDLPGIEP